MKVGVILPTAEFGADPGAIRDFAQTVEAVGFDFVVVFDHVLGANPERTASGRRAFTIKTPAYEPFVLMSFLAAATRRLELVSGVLILPQRQTALVAKQAATLDVLSGGRLRLGVGVGWHQIEYVALGQDFHTRGQRMEEQIEVMRRLWTEPLATFSGRWHTLPDAGLNPLPAQRPIPIWIGGSAEAAMRRMARLGDGWILGTYSLDEGRRRLEALDRLLAEAGRIRAAFGIQARIPLGQGGADEWVALAQQWETAGATHVELSIGGRGFTAPAAHLSTLREVAQALGRT